MTKMIFVNLPVTDLPKSTAFYKSIGFTQNEMFSDDTASGMEWSDTIKVMLLNHEKWASFTSKPIVDAHAAAQVALCVSMESREAVDAITETAGKNGGKADINPKQEFADMMYGRSFEDPDGHVWEPMWMNPSMATDGPPAEAMTDA